MTIEDDFKN